MVVNYDLIVTNCRTVVVNYHLITVDYRAVFARSPQETYRQSKRTLDHPGLSFSRPWTILDHCGLPWTVVDCPGMIYGRSIDGRWTTNRLSGLSRVALALNVFELGARVP
jgi:hypothetical protein